MVIIHKDSYNQDGMYAEMSGFSTDVKPTNVTASSLFLELDTNKIYYFDGQNWHEVGTASMSSDVPIVAPIDDGGGESPIK